MKTMTADERLREAGGANNLIVGPSGVGKTSLLRTLSQELLASTLFIDIEAGDLAVADLPVASVRPRQWSECRDLACILGGDGKPVRVFVCTNPNPWGYPAKDRSGRLEQLEPPHLGALIEKLTRPGARKPFTAVSPEQSAQT